MKIVVDVSPLSHPLAGIGNYIRGSLAGLVDAAADRHEIVAFAPTSLKGPGRIREALAGIDVETRLWPLPASHALRTGWSRLGRPPVERLVGRLDAFHFTDWMYPAQRGGIRATTIHDLVPLRFPEWCTPRTRAMHGRKYENAARTCDLVFVNSAYTGGDVVERLGVDEEKIRVAYPGVRDVFATEGRRAELAAPYVLTVATLEPRKNLETLVEAHRAVGGELLLAVAGGEGWGDQPLLDDPRIVRLGFVPDGELAALYRGAEAAVYPSRFEGFGIPIVEAMACGCPVVASSHASMDEAAGDVALRADPESPASIAAAIDDAIRRRDQLVAPGVAHAAAFTWARTGEVFLRGFEEVAA